MRSVVRVFHICEHHAKIVKLGRYGHQFFSRLAKRREILIVPRTAGNTGNSREILVIPRNYWEIGYSLTKKLLIY